MSTECLRLTDEDLSRVGKERIEWAWRKMPVLHQIRAEWEQSLPLKGIKIAACLHISAKTANLARVLKIGGADLVLCASNPLSTQDDIAAALNVVYEIPTFARRGVDNDSYYKQTRRT
jgi:adenosylhomocysteinase